MSDEIIKELSPGELYMEAGRWWVKTTYGALQARNPTLQELCDYCHKQAVAKGFWPDEGRNFGETIALITSELSEALEAKRHGDKISTACEPATETEEEIADAFIRLFDAWAGFCKTPLQQVIARKLEYNRGRPMKHGKAF